MDWDKFQEDTGLTREQVVMAAKGWTIMIAIAVVCFKAGKRSEAKNHPQ